MFYYLDLNAEVFNASDFQDALICQGRILNRLVNLRLKKKKHSEVPRHPV